MEFQFAHEMEPITMPAMNEKTKFCCRKIKLETGETSVVDIGITNCLIKIVPYFHTDELCEKAVVEILNSSILRVPEGRNIRLVSISKNNEYLYRISIPQMLVEEKEKIRKPYPEQIGPI